MKANPETDKAFIQDTLRGLLAGNVAVTDAPGVLFVGELLELYPDAVVICTTRDTQSWFRSYSDVANRVSRIVSLMPIFWPIPSVRYLKTWRKTYSVRYEMR